MFGLGLRVRRVWLGLEVSGRAAGDDDEDYDDDDDDEPPALPCQV